MVEQVVDFVRLYAKVAYRITGKPQKENVYEYPLEAIGEAVIKFRILHSSKSTHLLKGFFL